MLGPIRAAPELRDMSQSCLPLPPPRPHPIKGSQMVLTLSGRYWEALDEAP